jgi:hypothetical protein
MQKHILIETITNEMCCANECPMYYKPHYDIDKCKCYKSVVIKNVNRLFTALEASTHALRSYQCGNSSIDLAKKVADENEIITNGEPSDLIPK